MNARLSVTATPIGNLGDITARALEALRACDAVLCEDTRVTAKLMAHFGIEKPLVSYHAHSGAAKYDKVFALLEEGKHLVLVSDAGTPTVSDPGAHLVREVRARFGDEVRIDALPGPSAVVAALSISGATGDMYTFFGFPPHKKGRKTFFDTLAACPHTAVLYESPHRIVKALEALTERMPDRPIAVCREITKLYEEVRTGTPADVLAWFTARPDTVRGEFVVVVYGPDHPRG
jgi:16S rRNA (cytidine1402-2'-O)-methyltransferase